MPRAVGESFGGRTIEQFKATFFDSEKVIRAMDRATRRNLSRAGAFVRRSARQSIKKAPKADPKTGKILKGRRKKGAIVVDATALPGKPPFGHGQQKLKKFVFFAYDADRKTMIVGPAKLDGTRGGGPEFIEYGGPTTIRTRRGRARSVRFHGNPFMRPALDAGLEQVRKLYHNCI